MKFTRRPFQWVLLNYLVLLPWISCQKLDISGEVDEDSPKSLNNKRSLAYNDETRLGRNFYRLGKGRETIHPAPSHRHFGVVRNPDFHFDYNRDENHANEKPFYPTTTEQQTKKAPAAGVEFSYSEKSKAGPSHWHRFAPQCGGRFQSPIMINSSSALNVKRKRQLQMVGQTNLPREIKLENDGHSAKFTYLWNEGDRPYIRGGPLLTKYYFQQFHFHWGSNNSVGSEHVLDHRRYPMELHLVFYSALYPSFDEAKNEVGGLAVIAIFYEIYDIYNEPLNPWTRFLKQIIEPDSEHTIPFYDSFPLYELIGHVDWPYYSYEGSLTTPPCLETVTWIVSTKPLLITPSEIQQFRRLKTKSGPMVNNYRPTQKLHNRRVFHY